MKALITLTPEQSKILIALGVVAHPSVVACMRKGRIAVCRGTTNAMVLETLMKLVAPDKRLKTEPEKYFSGWISHEGLVANQDRSPEIWFKDGIPEIIEKPQRLTIIERMRKGDVVIKGGNAIDASGNVGVLIADPKGGTIGNLYVRAKGKGLVYIIPIGLEKMIAGDIIELSNELGIDEVDAANGFTCGMMPVTGDIITEIQALELLYSTVSVEHVASGGLKEGKGTVVLLIDGEKDEIEKILELKSKLALVNIGELATMFWGKI